MDHLDTISVIIPTKNEEENINNCLKSIYAQTLLPSEVFVVDGRSTDKTLEIVQEYPAVLLTENYHTRGGARHVGVQASTSEYVVFTDGDCIASEQWLEKLIQGFTEDTVGVGGGLENLSNNTIQQGIANVLDSYLGGANSVQDRVFSEDRTVDSLSGSNSMFRREDILKVGGYNTELNYNEDTDISNRMKKLGVLRYIKDALVFHNQDLTLSAFAKRMYQFGRGRSQIGIFGVQILLPLYLPFILFSYLIDPLVFFAYISLYSVLITIFSLHITVKQRKLELLFLCPLLYII